MRSSLRFSIAIAAAMVVGLPSFAPAQMPSGGTQRSPMYDVKSETTITGTVESMTTIAEPAGRGRRGLGGTHLVVKTDTETLEVHLGPTEYLKEQAFTVEKGDTVDVLGSRVTIDGVAVLLARQITKGTAKWTLRDESGRPLWRRSRR